MTTHAKGKLNIYIHILFSTIHDAYIYVIRITMLIPTQKRNHSRRAKSINLKNEFLKIYLLLFKRFHLLEPLSTKTRKKIHALRGYIRFIYRSRNEHAKLPQRCSHGVPWRKRAHKQTTIRVVSDKNQTDDAIFLGVLAISTVQEESVEQREPPGWRHCRCFAPWNGQPTDRPTNQPWTNLSRQPCSPVFHTCSWEWVVPGTNISRRSFRFVKQAPYVPSIPNVHIHGGERVKGGADRGRGWVSTPANTCLILVIIHVAFIEASKLKIRNCEIYRIPMEASMIFSLEWFIFIDLLIKVLIVKITLFLY